MEDCFREIALLFLNFFFILFLSLSLSKKSIYTYMNKYIYTYIFFFRKITNLWKKKICNFSKIVLVLLSTLVKIFSFSCMLDFLKRVNRLDIGILMHASFETRWGRPCWQQTLHQLAWILYHVTQDLWHGTRGEGWTFSQNFSSLARTDMETHCFEDILTNDDWESYLRGSYSSGQLGK